MATHSSTLAWKIPWMEELGRLQSMGSLRVRHDWMTSLSLFTFMRWRRKWQPTPVFLPGESLDSGAWWAAIYGVAQSRTGLKQLSNNNNNISVWETEIRFKTQRICPGNSRLSQAFFPHSSWGILGIIAVSLQWINSCVEFINFLII